METININDVIHPQKRITKLVTGSEIMLAVALNAYTKYCLNKQLDCSGVRVHKDLLSQPIFNFACDPVLQQDGVIFHKDDKPQGNKNNMDLTQFFPNMLTITEGYVIKTTDETWEFSYQNDLIANSRIQKGNRKYNYLYIVAKYFVWCYMHPNAPVPKLIINRNNYSIIPDEYAALIILQKYGNKILTPNIFELQYSTEGSEDYEWLAYWEEKRERGLAKSANFVYSPTEKIARLRALNLHKGDVVLLYKRKASKNNGDITQNVMNCYPAVIYGYDENGITLCYYTHTDLKLTRRYHMDIMRDNGGGEIYTRSDYLKFDSLNKHFDWYQIGVEGCSSNESVLIIPPVADDTTWQYLNNGERDVHVELNTLETIYALFKDRGIKYDEKRFLEKYFKGKVPVYDQFEQKRQAYLKEHGQG